MTEPAVRDYADWGMTIQHAMNDHAIRFPDRRTRPRFLLWSGLRIWTSDVWTVPKTGIVRGEFLSAKDDVEQGFDLKVDGWIQLKNGEHVAVLRTWRGEGLEDVVEYPFCSRDGLLWVWNVYRMRYSGGQVVEEKWTENAGFWVERLSENERVYHCSHGMANPPDFESLVFKIQIGPMAPGCTCGELPERSVYTSP